ncbi:Uncharacterised protein [Vibrio cholerae]|nr:Uncharacterised protein [Vibrio cholerae]CSC39344.1 Uncharacterised protein [Vibrio cholerae]
MISNILLICATKRGLVWCSIGCLRTSHQILTVWPILMARPYSMIRIHVAVGIKTGTLTSTILVASMCAVS